MKINKYFLIAIFGAGLALQSCNKWLDIKPKLELEREELYSSEQGFEDALTGCYAKLKEKDLFGNVLTMNSMEYMAQHWAPAGNSQEFSKFNYQNEAVKTTFKAVYNNLYTVIAQANDMIYYLDLRGREVIASEAKFKLLKGEALAVRAFCHFELLRVFGQTPQKSTITVNLPYAERASEEAVPAYDFDSYTEKLLRDFLKAEKLLSESDPLVRYTFDELNDPNKLVQEGHTDFGEAFRRIRLNYWAVKGLIARYYTYLGDKTMAYEYANQVITAKVEGGKAPLSLEHGKTDVHNEAYTLPSETLFALHVYNLETQITGLFDGPEAYSTARTKDVLLKEVFANEQADIRYSLFIEQTGSTGKKLVNKKYWQSKAGMGLNGNTSVGAADNFVTMQMIPIIRLAELYLIAVESAPSMAESDRLMREFKEHRGAVHVNYPTRAERARDVQNQYNGEFWAEGQMFYFYKRTNAQYMIWGYKEVLERDYVIPMPDGEF